MIVLKFGDRYLEWSDHHSQPVTLLMSADRMRQHIIEDRGDDYVGIVPVLMKRLDDTGCSVRGFTAESFLKWNLAGRNGQKISEEEIAFLYDRDNIGEDLGDGYVVAPEFDGTFTAWEIGSNGYKIWESGGHPDLESAAAAILAPEPDESPSP